MGKKSEAIRAGVPLTNLDQPLFEAAAATKRDLIDYLDAVADRIVLELSDRPLSVIRVRPGQQPFMQKNLPKYAPNWIQTIVLWAEASKREVSYALCNDRRTLLWFANQRAVEYHVTLMRATRWDEVTYLVLDLDPPAGKAEFALAAEAAQLVRQALSDAGLAGAVKTSGAKGVHVYVPVAAAAIADAAAATRAIAARAAAIDPQLATTAFVKDERGGKVFIDSTRAGGATVIAPYSPRIRPGVPVSYPVAWADLDRIVPSDFTIRTAPTLMGEGSPWADELPQPHLLPGDLVEEGHAIPVARVQAMHEGKRRARERRTER